MAPPLRVLVVGEDPLARSGLVQLLSARDDLALAGQAGPEEAASALRSTDAEVVVWDMGPDILPDTDALAGLSGLRGPALVVLTAADGAVPELLGAGAQAVLGREADASRLAAAVHAAAQGLLVLDERLSESVLRRRPAAARIEPLTPRETEVLALLGQGLSNRGIAERLAISEHTAKFHVNAILGKLDAQTRAEAVAQGVRLGLLLL